MAKPKNIRTTPVILHVWENRDGRVRNGDICPKSKEELTLTGSSACSSGAADGRPCSYFHSYGHFVTVRCLHPKAECIHWAREEPASVPKPKPEPDIELGKLYRDWLSVRDGDQSAYPSVETLIKYQRWAEELVIGGRREYQGADFRRFCRVRLEGKARGLDLMTAGTAYRNGKDYPAPEDWEFLSEAEEPPEPAEPEPEPGAHSPQMQMSLF